jgi:RNA polymerase sigma-70 factor (ECF subfamily)
MNREPSDEQLIDEFLVGNQEKAQSAFERLVTRHGPSVMGVCRHVLKQEQDAEDVFQATFLMLARRAATIQNPRVLGAWLREVAFRDALRMRAQGIRRRALPAHFGEQAGPEEAESQATRNELRLILHAEVDRLPEGLRTLVVHCYLEGKTNEEVARLLGSPIGTIKRRLWKARAMLRAGLLRRRGRDAAELAAAWG